MKGKREKKNACRGVYDKSVKEGRKEGGDDLIYLLL